MLYVLYKYWLFQFGPLTQGKQSVGEGGGSKATLFDPETEVVKRFSTQVLSDFCHY